MRYDSLQLWSNLLSSETLKVYDTLLLLLGFLGFVLGDSWG